jgi:hypothetical protein
MQQRGTLRTAFVSWVAIGTNVVPLATGPTNKESSRKLPYTHKAQHPYTNCFTA